MSIGAGEFSELGVEGRFGRKVADEGGEGQAICFVEEAQRDEDLVKNNLWDILD